jgi:hypothetical protein
MNSRPSEASPDWSEWFYSKYCIVAFLPWLNLDFNVPGGPGVTGSSYIIENQTTAGEPTFDIISVKGSASAPSSPPSHHSNDLLLNLCRLLCACSVSFHTLQAHATKDKKGRSPYQEVSRSLDRTESEYSPSY